LRTNDNGVISLELTNDGLWYLKTIHLVESSQEGLTHESNWATVTFEVTHTHESDDHNTDSDDAEIPTWIFIVVSLVVIGGRFLLFSRRREQ
jgi:hypothetical protein